MTLPTPDQISYAQHLQTSSPPSQPNQVIKTTHSTLSLTAHPEGGYFVETDRDPLKVPNPFRNTKLYENATVNSSTTGETDQTETRNASTTIHYFLDPQSPIGIFHRNKGRTVHTHHRGRGVYVLIHADEVIDNVDPEDKSRAKARVETFVVGPDIANGERIQWIVEGGKFKASFLLPDQGHEESQSGLLISETVVPGFEFADHDFLTIEGLIELVSAEDFERLIWLVKKEAGK